MLLLNTCLTVKAGDAGSHSGKGWETFTDKVVDVVDKFGGANLANASGASGRGRGIVFLAWGAWAAKRVAKLDKVCALWLASRRLRSTLMSRASLRAEKAPYSDECGKSPCCFGYVLGSSMTHESSHKHRHASDSIRRR